MRDRKNFAFLLILFVFLLFHCFFFLFLQCLKTKLFLAASHHFTNHVANIQRNEKPNARKERSLNAANFSHLRVEYRHVDAREHVNELRADFD